MAGNKGIKHYPLCFRQEVVNKHDLEGISYSHLSKQYQVPQRRIQLWCQWQRQYGLPKQMTGKQRGRPKTSDKEESLVQKVKRLEMENELLKKFNELLEEEETKQK